MFFRISSSTILPNQVVIDGVNYIRSNKENFVIRELSKGIAFETELTNLKLDVYAKHFDQIVNLDAIEHLYAKRTSSSLPLNAKKRRLNDEVLIDYAQKHIVKKQKTTCRNISSNDYHHQERNIVTAIKQQSVSFSDLSCIALSFLLRASYTSSIHHFVSLFKIGSLNPSSEVGYNYLDLDNKKTYLVGWELHNCKNGKVKQAVDEIMARSKQEINDEDLSMVCFKVTQEEWYADVKMVLWDNNQPSIDGPKPSNNSTIDLTT